MAVLNSDTIHTHCHIGIEQIDGSVKYIEYPNKKDFSNVLLKHYNTREKVNAFFASMPSVPMETKSIFKYAMQSEYKKLGIYFLFCYQENHWAFVKAERDPRDSYWKILGKGTVAFGTRIH